MLFSLIGGHHAIPMKVLVLHSLFHKWPRHSAEKEVPWLKKYHVHFQQFCCLQY